MLIFLTGASGLVGGAFAEAAQRRGHRLIGVTSSFTGDLPHLHAQLTLDLTDAEATHAAIMDVFPDVIVNAAAISEPARCDADPDKSQAMNVALPAALARTAHHLGARFIHLSSEQVFDGTRPPYRHTDPVAPINRYARQKVESEAAVRTACPEGITVRAPLLMGNSPSGRRSLHERLLADWAAGRTPTLFTDEIRQPCTAENLGEAMVELVERREIHGVHHWAGATALSRYEMGLKLRTHFKLSESYAPLTAARRADHPEACASRQADLRLDLASLSELLQTQPESFDEQLPSLEVPAPCQAWYKARR